MGGHKSLVAVLFFNAITAIIGGAGLLSHSIIPPPQWLLHTPFHSYFVPGVVLLVVVGGSSLFAALSTWRKTVDAGMAALLAGFVVLAWTVIQIIIVEDFNWLQGLYLLSGSFVVIQSARPNVQAKE